jgi:hypothetical protein
MDMNPSKGAQAPSVFRRPPPPRAPAPRVAPAAAAGVPLAIGERIATPGTAGRTDDPDLDARRRRGAHWLYWIAALSLVNTVVGLAGLHWRFIIGLGLTQLFQETGGAAHVIGLGVIALFALLGQRAVAGKLWAYMTGMIVYGIDGLIFVLIQDWIGVAFHAFAILMISRGLMAARRLAA